MTGLSTAESHLMRTHRVEVADALREVCRSILWNTPEARYHVIKQLTGTRNLRISGPMALRTRAEDAMRHLPVHLRSTREVALLDRNIELSGRQRDLEFTQLVAASLRLDPSPKTASLTALNSLYAGKPEQAAALLRDALKISAPASARACTLTNLGWALSQLGDARESFNAYSEATRIAPSRVTPALSLLVNSIFLVDRKETIRAASAVNALLAAEHPAVDSFVQLQVRHCSESRMVPGKQAKILARGCLRFTQGAARRVLEVFI